MVHLNHVLLLVNLLGMYSSAIFESLNWLSILCTSLAFLYSYSGVISFRLASSDQTRLFESYQTFVSRVNAMCLGKFQREIEREQREVEVERKTRTDKSRFYDVFRRKVLTHTSTYTHLLIHTPTLKQTYTYTCTWDTHSTITAFEREFIRGTRSIDLITSISCELAHYDMLFFHFMLCTRSQCLSPPPLQLSLAVAYEMTMQHCQAMQLYTEALNDLECALSTYADDKAPPTWLKSIIASPCNSWDYPTLVWDNTTWKVGA